MALHLIKLCVGCDGVEDLEEWIETRLAEKRRRGEQPEHSHITRMIPKRMADLLDGGSLYWVIRGNVLVRQRLIDIRPFQDGDGIHRCHLVLEPELNLTEWQPRRPFQGWRYLKPSDAPADLGTLRGSSGELPHQMQVELANFGLR